jgi:uncharacterized membrane protein
MLLATIAGTPYKIVLVLHILAAILGFGSVMLNGVYASEVRRRPGPEGAAIADANYKVSFGVAMYIIYAIPILGIALVTMSEKAWKFSQSWVWLALVLYVVLIGLVHGVHRPNVRRLDALMRESRAGDAAEIERRGRLAETMGMVLSLLVVASLVLMVFKPGAPGS